MLTVVGGWLNTGKMASIPPILTPKPLSSVSPCMYLATPELFFLYWSPRRVPASKNLCVGPLRGHLGFQLIFTTGFYVGAFSWHWCSEWGSHMWGWDLYLPGCDLCRWAIFSDSRTSVCFVSLPLQPVSVWLLYILRYRTSVQLVCRWLSRLIVLWFSCTFDVVMGGGECSVHLLCHLDQIPWNYTIFRFIWREWPVL